MSIAEWTAIYQTKSLFDRLQGVKQLVRYIRANRTNSYTIQQIETLQAACLIRALNGLVLP